MEIIFNKQQETQGIIKISINKFDFQPGVDQKIKEYSKTANIKGFRPGKVPPRIIKKRYGTALIVDEINKLVSEKLNNYLKQSDIQFLGEPLAVEKNPIYDWETDENFDFEYEVGFAESFEIKVDKKVKMDKYSISIDDKVIDETIENLQRQFGKVEVAEASSEKDTLHGQLTSKTGSFVQDISIDLRDIERDTLKKLVGIKPGEEVEIDIKKAFKNEATLKNQLRINDDDLKKIKGKVQFLLKTINHHQLVPVNQELFDQTFGKGTIEDKAAFRNRVKEIVCQNYLGEEEQFFNYQVREKITASTKIHLPDEFLKKWLMKTNNSITSEALEFEYASYSKELKWSLIRNRITKDQGIKVEHEDIVNEAKVLIKKQFAGSGINGQMDNQIDTFANNYLQGENGENYMKVHNQVQTDRVLDYIKNEITIKEKIVSLDEFREL